MSIDITTYQPQGDKKNTEFFYQYLTKIYERRKASGAEQLIGEMDAVLVQVETGDALAYLKELYLMTPYRYKSSYLTETHRIYFLTNKPEYPMFVVFEPLSNKFVDSLTRLNMLYPNARPKPNARYIGELYKSTNLTDLIKILEKQDIRFHHPNETINKFFTHPCFAFTPPSDYCANRVGFTSISLHQEDELNIGQKFSLTKQQLMELNNAEQKAHDLGTAHLILGIDHMATRILSGEREDAILEFLMMANYYYWGSYNINEMNSSTNVNRNLLFHDDKRSPAKVFTANNTPSFVNSFEGLPMPTENFVRNFGKRMHHIAYEIQDGDHPTGMKNIDYVVGKLQEQQVPFLAHIVGACNDSPDLKQIFSKHSEYSILITEYVERCHGYDGFFTKTNVAALTEAAGLDERLHHGQVFD